MIAGLPQFSGCPDTDQDGIADFEDRCPLTPGTVQNLGCPTQNMDADGDGVLNPVDRCPYVPGLPQFQGCPDTDQDGLSDLDDRCPTLFGPVQNQGCPQQNGLQQNAGIAPAQPTTFPSFGPIEFDTDQAVIKPFYFERLNQLAEYMLAHPNLTLLLSGHTDAEGNQMYNMILGQNRAEAVKYYLIIRGVEAKRIDILSYGEIMPKTDNQSTNGKARNRRTELILMQ